MNTAKCYRKTCNGSCGGNRWTSKPKSTEKKD